MSDSDDFSLDEFELDGTVSETPDHHLDKLSAYNNTMYTVNKMDVAINTAEYMFRNRSGRITQTRKFNDDNARRTDNNPTLWRNDT